MEYFRRNIKVGMLLFIAVFLLTVLILMVGDFQFKKPAEYKVYFTTISGLGLEAPVTYAGYEVGKVSAIRILPPKESVEKEGKHIEVTIQLHKKGLLCQDSIVAIMTLGFMGEKYIDISPGSKDAKVLEPCSELYGKDSQDFNVIVERLGDELDYLTPKLHKVAEEVSSMSEKMESIVSDIKEKEYVPKLFESANKALDNAEKFVEEMREIVASARKNIQETLNNIEDVSADVKKEIPEILSEVNKGINQIRQVIEKADTIVSNVDGVVDENRETVRTIVCNVEKITENFKDFSRTLKKHPWRLIWKTPEEKREEREKKADRRQRRKPKDLEGNVVDSDEKKQGGKLLIGNKFKE